MANFLQAFNLTSINEGGYANNPKDNGGETFRGIARKFWPAWAGWKIIDAIKKKVGKAAGAIDREAATNKDLSLQVQSFYIQNFWAPLKLDAIASQKIANKVYDIAVNMGTEVAGEFMQRAVNLFKAPGSKIAVDGNPGTQTINAVNSLSVNDALLAVKYIASFQGSKYAAIIEANPGQYIFARSWGSRL